MAKQQTPLEEIEKIIRLRLVTDGSENIEKELAAAVKQAHGLYDTFGDITDVYGDMNKLATDAIRISKKQGDSDRKRFSDLSNLAKSAAKSVSAILMPGGFRAAVKTFTDYNAKVVQTTASLSRFGMTLTQTGNMIDDMSSRIGLTREATAGFMNQISSNVRMPAMENMEEYMTMMYRASGFNEQAMEKNISLTASLSQVSFSLGQKIMQHATLTGEARERSAEAIANETMHLYDQGSIQQEQYVAAMGILSISEKMTAEEEEKMRKIQEGQAALSSLETSWGKIKVAVGEAIAPLLAKVAEWLEKALNESNLLNTDFEKWAKILGGIYGAWKAFGWIKRLKGIFGFFSKMTKTSGMLGKAMAAMGPGLLPWAIAIGSILATYQAIQSIIDKFKKGENIAEKYAPDMAGELSWLDKIGVGSMDKDILANIEKQEAKHKEMVEKKAAKVKAAAEEEKKIEDEKKKAVIDAATARQAEFDLADQMESSLQSHLSLYQSLAKTASLTGDIQSDSVNKAYHQAKIELAQTREQQEKVIRLLKEKAKSEDPIARAKSAKQLNEANIALQNTYQQQAKLLETMSQKYTGLLAMAGAQTRLQGALIQLQDNYAIGVGASAKARMEQASSLQREIDLMRAQAEEYKSNLDWAKASTEEKAKAYEMDAAIAEKMNAQAQITKSLRDGWISAISAMNAGFGGFSEIVMNAEQNVAQAIKGGAVLSSVSGAIGAGGYTSSERINERGEVTAKGRSLEESAYLTDMDKRMGITDRRKGLTRVMEATQRKNAQGFLNDVGGRTRASSGSFEASAAGASSIAKGAIVEKGSSMSASINMDKIDITVEVGHIDELAKKVADAVATGLLPQITTSLVESMSQMNK